MPVISHTSKDLFPKLLDNSIKIEDERGHIDILYESDTAVLKRTFSRAGIFRGMHIQDSPYPQKKVFRVISGKILDFIADISDNGEVIWYSEINPADEWVLIDSNYAHGFYAVEDSVFEYFCDGAYNEAHEQSYRIDKIIQEKIDLPNLRLSVKDQKGKAFGKIIHEFRPTKSGGGFV